MNRRACLSAFRWIAAGLGVLLVARPGGMPTSAARAQAPAAGTAPSHYRVEMVVEHDGERMVMRRYVDGNRSRTEFDNDGETYVTIEAGDAARTTYTIVPSMKRVMKSTLPQDAPGAQAGSQTSAPEAPDDGLELVGSETLDGRPVQKYRVKNPNSDGFIWVDPSTELPVRMEAGGARVDLRNYDFSKPAPELFQIPKGYEVMDLDELRMSAARMVAGGLASGYAARAGESAGGSIGASIGGAFGGPLGSMVGQFLGKKLGKAVAQKAAGAVVN